MPGLVVDGDSIAVPALVSSPVVGWPALTSAATGKSLFFNGAAPGLRLDQIVDRCYGAIASLGAVSGMILVADGAYNDLIQAADPATCFARWQVLIAKYRAVGFQKIVWMALMSAIGSPLVNANYETYRLAFNGLVANSGLVDRIVNFDGVVISRNPDLLHPDDNGQLTMFPLIATAVNSF